MKRRTIHLLGFIEFLILLTTLLFFVLANDKTIQYAAEKVEEAFDITAEEIDGSLLRNLTLKNVRYKESLLASKAHIDINFKALLSLQIKIDDISLQEVDLDVLESLIKEMQKSKKDTSDTHFDNIPTIAITSLFFSTKPYEKYGLHMDEFKFNATEFKGDLHQLQIGSFSLYTENDHTNITADGTLLDKHLAFNHLWITDVNISKIEALYHANV